MEEAVSKRADWRELAAACFIDTDTDAGHWRGEGADRAGEVSVMSTILKAAGSAYLYPSCISTSRYAWKQAPLSFSGLNPCSLISPGPCASGKRCQKMQLRRSWRNLACCQS